MATDEQVRTFVAVELPDEVKEYLSRLQSEMRAVQPHGIRWVRPEGIHLTLKFLGNVSPSRIPEIEAAIARGCEEMRHFTITLSSVGVFPSRSRPRVIWVGLEGDIRSLADLQGRIDEEFEALGFGRESRPFKPHLTLGRVEDEISLDTRRQVGEMVDRVKVVPVSPFEVRVVSLMRSKLMRGGAVYSRLLSIGL